MNFIFDFGNVLVDYKPLEYLNGLFSDAVIADKINEIVFKSREWLLMDQGFLTQKESLEIFCEREPEYKNEIRFLMENVMDMFTPVTGTVELLPVLKKSGHKLYYLSNIQIEVRDYILKNNEFVKLFDGGVFSCDVNIIKPSPEIYRSLIEKYSLIPAECIFFDDMEENVKVAEKEGIKSILFTTAADVLDFI